MGVLKMTRRVVGTYRYPGFRDALIVCVCLTLATRALGQISPGELSGSHASLEGMTKCTSCHSLGKAIASEKCLACHTEIADRIQAKQGFHGSFHNRPCVECHKEHHGRNFSLTRFEPKGFKHESVGFSLAGRHAALQCRECHKPVLIKANNVREKPSDRRERTYLGLGKDCLSCHADKHRGQFHRACTDCHNQEHWKPVDSFSHEKTKFPLTGLHARVDCQKCHKVGTDAAKTVMYVGLSFSTCTSCHKDPHNGKFGPMCDRCHSTQGWMRGSTANFNHTLTRFPLTGRHKTVLCEKCHVPAGPSTKPAGGGKRFQVASFQTCTSCHKDAHNGQFARKPSGGQCENCHSVDGYLPSKFTMAMHQQSRFPLEGAHRAAPCFRCHPSGPEGGTAKIIFFRSGEITCVTCHEDVHKGEFNGRMTKSCATCHSIDAWMPVSFSHDSTRFPLDGKHRGLPCVTCHKTAVRVANSPLQFNGLPIHCEGCHAGNVN